MRTQRLAVRARDYTEHVGDARFVALPREEVERLHGRIHVLSIPHQESDTNLAYLPLHAFVVLHYNYTWLSFGRAVKSLGVTCPFTAREEPAPFLDDAYQVLARRSVEERVALPGCDWRLAGLLRDDQLGLVYLARLRQPWAGASWVDGEPIQLVRNGDLQQSLAELEPRSQLLVEHLDAF